MIGLFLAFLVFIRPFQSGMSEPSSNWFFLLILLLLLLLHIIKGGKSYSTSLDPFLSFFYLTLIIGLFNSFSKNEAIENANIFFSYLILFFLIIHHPPFKVRFFIILSSIFVSLYGIYQFFWGFKETEAFILTHNLSSEFFGRLSSKRIFSTFVYPNSFAGYLVLVIPLLFNLKKKYFIMFLPLFYALYLTGSRGGVISFFFSLFLFFILRKKRVLILIFTFLFFLLTIYYLIPMPSSLIARWGYAKASIKIIKDNPCGTGLASFKDMYFKYKLENDEETRMAHNNYLQIGVELGILGFISFILIVGFIAYKGFILVKKDPSLEGFYIGSLTSFFHSIVDFDLYVPEITFLLFFFIGMLFSFERKEGKSHRLFSFFLIIPIILLSLYCFKMMEGALDYEKAMEHLFKNEYSLACRALEEAVNINKNPEWLVMLGRMKERKDISSSLWLYKQAQEGNPHCAYYNFCVGRVFLKMGRKKEAMPFLKRASSLYPTNALYKNYVKDN